jgi:phospholipid/cholesterol/gamma-HCH transport system ATP-binding protein
MGGGGVDHGHVISIRGVRNQFGEHLVHDELELDVRRGEVLGIVGASGTGKSVLLRTMIGLRRPQAGTVHVLGTEVHTASDADRARLERRWGVLFQDGALFSSLTVSENIQVPLKEHLGIKGQLAEEIAMLKILLSGLPSDAGAKYPRELSGGMRKRAGIARSIAMDPEIVFLDEPTAGLDPIGAAGFDQLVRRLQATLGLTVVMITHDVDSLNTICDRIAVLAEKRVLAVGSWSELLDVDHPWIRDYFHGPRARAAARS